LRLLVINAGSLRGFFAHRASERVRQLGQTYSGTWFTTTHRIKKELSICQSLLCLDLVSFPVLSQIKPQAPIFRVA